jgi:hypothetical protein
LILKTEKVQVVKGTEAQVLKSSVSVMEKEIKRHLQPLKIFEEDLFNYKSVSMKIESNEHLTKSLNQELLEKFRKKKEQV